MNEPGSTNQPGQVLSYQAGSENGSAPGRVAVMFIGGFVAGCAGAAVCGCVWIVWNFPGTSSSQRDWVWPLCVTVVIAALLAVVAIRAHWNRNLGLLLGVLIGVGVTSLLEGLCFAT